MEDKYFISIADEIFKTRKTINAIGFLYDGSVKCCAKHFNKRFKAPIFVHRNNPTCVLWLNKPSKFEHIYAEEEVEYDIIPNKIPEYNKLIKQFTMGKTFKDKKNYNPEEAKVDIKKRKKEIIKNRKVKATANNKPKLNKQNDESERDV